MEPQGTTVIACTCLKGGVRDKGVIPDSDRKRKPPQSAAWKGKIGCEEKEMSLGGLPSDARVHPEAAWIVPWL